MSRRTTIRSTSINTSGEVKGNPPHPVDVYVGQRVRQRRLLAGMTQSDLASAVGLTFQQVQKYEKGANRISASRLYRLSKVLNVWIGWFFEDADEAIKRPSSSRLASAPDAVSDAGLLENNEAIELIGAYWRIGSAESREALLHLVARLSANYATSHGG